MRYLLIGGSGQVGWELQRTLAPRGEVHCPGRRVLDLCEPDTIREVVRQSTPDVVVNAAAYNDVDGAEAEPEIARRVNGEAPAVLADEARRIGAVLIHYSTDYVFGGDKGRSYTEDDEPDPVNAYGRSKRQGERAVIESDGAHLVFRLSWVYGRRRPNFVTTMLRLFRERDEVDVVDDQWGSPSWCRTAAEVTVQVLAAVSSVAGDPRDGLRRHTGLYHLAANGRTTRYEQARAIQRHAHRLWPRGSFDACEIRPIASSEYPAEAARPRATPLCSARIEQTFGLSLPAWETDLIRCLEDQFLAG